MSNSNESYVLININDRANLEYSLDNNDPSVDDETHTQNSYSTLTTTLYSYQDPHQDNDNDHDHHMNNTILDVELGTMSPIPTASIRAIVENVFSSGVLLYLTSKDLCRLSEVSRYFHQSCNRSYLWRKLLKIDFIHYTDMDNHDDNSSYHSMITNATTYPAPPKLLYIRRYKDVRRSFDMKKIDHMQWMKLIRTNRWKNMISSILDLTQFRIFIPLPFICMFLSMTLFALRLDDRINIRIWMCGIPLLIMFAYVMISFGITALLFLKRYEANSIFQQHFYQLRSPFTIIFNDENNGYKKIIIFFTLALVLLLIQLVLILVKLDTEYDGHRPYMLAPSVSWNIIFLPLWMLFGLYASIPMFSLFTEYNLYTIGFMFVWIPFLIFFVSLASKLTYDPDHHIRMSLILMPFWLLEGSVMISSLIYLSMIIKQRRLGVYENFNEIVGTVMSLWIMLSPFVIFQILLSVKDDDASQLTHMDVVVPMLVVLGVLAIGSTLIVCVLKTPFEEAQEESLESRAGISRLYRL